MKKLGWVLFIGAVASWVGCTTELEGNAPGLEDRDGAQACGDGMCHVSELGACESDCGVGAVVCGNGRCGAGESSETCPEDCGVGDDGTDEIPDEPEVCNYPAGPSNVQYEQVMPALSWTGAFQADGTTIDFGMRDFFCNDELWGNYTSVAFILGTGWCPACPDYIRHAAGLAAQARDSGMLFVFVEAEDRNYVPSNNYDANEFLKTLINDAPSIRIGDGVTEPTARTLYSSPVVTGFPSGWVVRRSDMMVIADQGHSQYILPWLQIAANPDGEWDGAVSDVPANCGAEDEEANEPNNDPKEAPSIQPGSFNGGVCAPSPDYFKIDLEGAWRFDLEFTHAIGDLDVYVWDMVTNEPMQENGRAIGSDSVSDNESFEFSGPAVIMVYGFNSNTATYVATLTDLSTQE